MALFRSLVLAALFATLCVGIPVSLMLPLDIFDNDGQFHDRQQLQAWLTQAKSGGVDGVMTDVWWGLVETSPKVYNWTGYKQLVAMVEDAGLKMQVVLSMHKCGTNVGDACYIPLPSFVGQVGNDDPDIYYRDSQQGVDEEYLSLGVDDLPLFGGRSAIQLYTDFMSSFASTFKAQLGGNPIDEIQVSMGPAGELRYPSYQLSKWSYCGIGEFQCYDKYMLADLASAASAAGHPEWGHGGPSNAGGYNSHPSDTGFFDSGNDNYQSDYGNFFLSWYNQKLLSHGDQILGNASKIFQPTQTPIAAKISGIHWWYLNPSHAAEVTAGYYNTNNNNAYLNIANMLKKHNATFDFTCLEMTNSNNGCGSAPDSLVKQTIEASLQAGINYAGENALPLCQPNCYQGGFDEIYRESTQYGPIARFTYLRMNQNLFGIGNNWSMFTAFVARMHSA